MADAKDKKDTPQQTPSWISSARASSGKGEETIRLNTADLLRFQQQYKQKDKHRGSLLVIDGTRADLGSHVTVENETIIGRETSGLQLRDRKCSRRHALVSRRENNYVVRDLGSTNGTFLNGVPLENEQPLRDGDKIVLGQTVIKFNLVDETEADYLKQVEQLVTTDDLTGLLAKHRFDAALEQAIHSAQSAGAPLGVLMMDMDGLKAINDRHGHQVGAFTISQVGLLIGRILEGKGDACRFGGDEFSAFLPRHDLTETKAVAEQIRHEVEVAQISHGQVKVNARISIGVATLPGNVRDVEGLLSLADHALYRAKAKGRNVVSD
jgi:two-component system cell cycle response regulator